MINSRARAICLTLIAFGLVISVYLLWRHAVLTGIWSGGGADGCLGVFGIGCDATLRSPTSVQFGLPLAGWGMVYYATLAAFMFLAYTLEEVFEFEAHFAAFLLSLPALVISLVLAGIMLTSNAPFCPLCALAHLINLALVFSLKRLTGRPITQLVEALAAGGKYLIMGKTADPVQSRWKLLGFFTVALFAMVLSQWVLIKAPSRPLSTNRTLDPQQILAAFETGAVQDIPVGADDPVLGPANAPAQIVVFSDFQCPACKGYARELHTLGDQYPEKLQIVFKHLPLDKACNPTLKSDFHTRACEAAFAAEAARRQGKFWPFHDRLFATDLRENSDYLNSLAQASGLDLRRFVTERLEEATRAKVRSDIELAVRVKVNATPTLFLNRRRVSDISPQAVRVLIDHVLKAAGH